MDTATAPADGRGANDFVEFELEAWQSLYEEEVAYNLADSGVKPVRLNELVTTPEATVQLLETELHYPAVGGAPELRARIADWQGCSPENVLVTVGTAEANAITVATLVRPGDHVVVMEPGYRQVSGCARNAGARVSAFPLDAARGWRPDLEALRGAVTPQTRLIAVTNPNNPVGTVLTEEEMDAIVAAAQSADAWLLADEVYRGSERESDALTPSFWGRCGKLVFIGSPSKAFGLYDKLVCTGSLSKAFGLSGLRCGWLVAPPPLRQDLWRRHEYAAISTGKLAMVLGAMALEEQVRDRLLARNRALVNDGFARLQAWIATTNGLVSLVPPQATALAFIRYHLDIPSLEVAHAIRTQGDVLVGAGSHFGVEQHLRITFALEPDYMDAALHRIAVVLGELKQRQQ